MDELNSFRALTIEAKWETDLEKQKKSIEKLGNFGTTAIPSLQEIMTITSRTEIRQYCIDAIKGIQRENTQDNRTNGEKELKETIGSKINILQKTKKKSVLKKKQSKVKSRRAT